MKRRAMSRGARYAGGAALLVLAYLVAFTTPGTALVEGSIVTTGHIGEQAITRSIAATVHDAQLAEQVDFDFWIGTTSGIWFVADATIVATTSRRGVEADVFIDGVRYPSTERVDTDTVDGSVIDAGFPVTGPILVELPADVLTFPGARSAVLRISPSGDSRLDGVIEVTIDLTTLEVESRLELEPRRDGLR